MRLCLRALLIVFFTVLAAPAGPAWAESGVPVMMYHRISATVPADPIGHDLTLTPRDFEAQLRYLSRARVRTMTAAQLVEALARGEHPRRTVVLTFDDGYVDAATVALPLLQKYHAVGTFYIVSGNVGLPRHVSWRQVRALAAAGMEIAAHGIDHTDLREYDRAGQKRQIEGSSKSLEIQDGKPVVTYAYPSGAYNATTIDVLRGTSIRAAFTTAPGLVTTLARPFELPRVRVHNGDGAEIYARYFPIADAGRVPADARLVLADAGLVRTDAVPAPGGGPASANASQALVDAQARAAGNRRAEAVRIGTALFTARWPAQVTHVRVDGFGAHAVAGLTVSGVKFHRPLSRSEFGDEMLALVARTFAASSIVEEVDVKATVPLSVGSGLVVSGDMAVPTSRTVFTLTARRGESEPALRARLARGDGIYWDPEWTGQLGKPA